MRHPPYSIWTVGPLACLAIFAACANEPDRPVDPRGEILVNADWLASHLDDADLVLLHVGDSDGYAAEHIPGAQFLTREQVSLPRSDSPDALTLELPNPDELAQVLESFGVSDDSKIVIYWGSEWVSQTTRVVLTLDWAGLDAQTKMLDGGIDAWRDAGYQLTDELPSVATGSLSLNPRRGLVVDADWLALHVTEPGYALVDARAIEYFSGEREGRVKNGHIPGAGSLHWMELLDDLVKLKSAEELTAEFASAGVETGDTVIAYCHIGQYATVVMFAARTLGHEVRFYDGSFQDWAAHDLPTETGIAGPSR